MVWNIINTIIALSALLLALKSFQRDVYKEKKENDASERRSKKAILTHFYEKNRPSFSKLHIINNGIAKGRDIVVYIDDAPIDMWEFAVSEDCKFSEIPPDNEVTIRIIEVDQMKTRYNLRITWNDDSGDIGNYDGFFEV